MDFLCELIFEVVLEGVFGVTVKNPKLKTWTRTVFFLLLAEVIPVLMLVSGISSIRSGNVDGGVVILILAVVVGGGFAASAIYGHKRDWKQDPD